MTKNNPEEPAADLFSETMPMKPLPPTTARVISPAAAVLEDPPERADFLHAILCPVGMPRRATDGRMFERTSGGAVLRLEAGAIFDGKRLVDQPLPYGTKPGLVMVHICGEAVRTQSRQVMIGDSSATF